MTTEPKIFKAKDIKLENLSWLLYGRSRAGKTTLIGTFPDPIFVVDFVNENGSISLRGHSSCDVVKVGTPEELDNVIEWILANAVSKGYKTVAIDSLTGLIELLNSSLGRQPTLQDWGIWARNVTSMIDRLRSLPVEKVYTATATIVKDEMGGASYGGPDLFRSLENRVPAKVDATVFVESKADLKGEVHRKAFLLPTSSMIAGVRGCLILEDKANIENPSYARMLETFSKPLFD